MHTRRSWTEAEDNALKECCLELGSRWWNKAKVILNREHKQCSSRLAYLKSLGFTYDKKNLINEESARILKEEIIKTPYNLKSAFERTSERTGLAPASVQCLYYGTYNTCMSKHNLGVCFVLLSKDSTSVNSKVIKDE